MNKKIVFSIVGVLIVMVGCYVYANYNLLFPTEIDNNYMKDTITT